MSGKLTVWLSVEDLEVIRDWIIKTVMAIDAANPADGRFFLPVERETYWRERRIGPALSGTIGIGVYSGTRHGVYSVMFHRVVEFAKERHPSKHARVYCCTLQMERFLAQLLLIRELPGVTASNFAGTADLIVTCCRSAVQPEVGSGQACPASAMRTLRHSQTDSTYGQWILLQNPSR